MTTTKPTKQQIRDYMQMRIEQFKQHGAPPPEPTATQKILDWHVKNERISCFPDGKCSIV